MTTIKAYAVSGVRNLKYAVMSSLETLQLIALFTTEEDAEMYASTCDPVLEVVVVEFSDQIGWVQR